MALHLNQYNKFVRELYRRIDREETEHLVFKMSFDFLKRFMLCRNERNLSWSILLDYIDYTSLARLVIEGARKKEFEYIHSDYLEFLLTPIEKINYDIRLSSRCAKELNTQPDILMVHSGPSVQFQIYFCRRCGNYTDCLTWRNGNDIYDVMCLCY